MREIDKPILPENLVLPVCKHCSDKQYLHEGKLVNGTFLLLQHVPEELAQVYMDLHQEAYHNSEGLAPNFVLYPPSNSEENNLAESFFAKSLPTPQSFNVSIEK